ncbi:hypothetical protein CPB84DRAFT_1791396 [Gymnopilus junonius]|uniref:Uncharacterized protein n=1 Tax=Gymnopilus junonius TaxID=109634 RepID=A0A9P5THK6_GYMJU|nr:hypothetical protein CPB84DRAFT_1791396 [Gymnopilus junonius]
MVLTFHVETSKAEEVMKELDDDNCLVIVLEALNGTECRIKTAGLWIDSPVGLNWKKFSKRLQHAFLQLFRSPQLRDLRLCGFNRLPLTFLCGAHITRLHLYGCLKETDASQEVLPAEETLPLPELDALVTDHELPVSYFERTISSELESAIDNLLYLYSTIFINADFAKCLEVIERSKHSLIRLSLRYEAVRVALQSYAGTFDLSNAQRLFNVCLHHYGGIPGPQAPTLGVLEDVIRFCNILRLPTSGSLRCLAFVIPMNQNENCAQFFLDSFHPEHQEFHKWSALDAALGRVCLGGVASIEILILTFEFNGQSKDKIPYGDSFVTAAEALVRKSLTSFAGGEKQKVPRVVIRIVFES